jgi:hypothetical protein
MQNIIEKLPEELKKQAIQNNGRHGFRIVLFSGGLKTAVPF